MLLFCLTLLGFCQVAEAQGSSSDAGSKIKNIIKEAEAAGNFNCSQHVGSRKCLSQKRCNNALKYLRAARDGNYQQFYNLEKYRNAYPGNERCMSSLVGAKSKQLVETLQTLSALIQQLNQGRSKN